MLILSYLKYNYLLDILNGRDETVVNNEGLNRKSSKRCCIYHKKRDFGESSTESEEENGGDDSSSSSGGGFSKGNKNKSKRPKEKKIAHKKGQVKEQNSVPNYQRYHA